MRAFIIYILFVYSLMANQEVSFFGTDVQDIEYTMGYDVGMREDSLRWNKGQANYEHTDGNTYKPNILSELIWDNVNSLYHRFVFKAKTGKYIFKTTLGYANSYNGDNQDSDYLYDNREGEYSRTNNSADDSTFRDFDISIGKIYPINEIAEIAVSLGYTNNLQKLKITSGYQTIPSTGAFGGLHSSYKALWQGPYISGDLELFKYEDLSLDMGVQYHLFDFSAKGNWNLREELMQPDSFKQDGTGLGYMMRSSMKYKVNDDVNFVVQYQKSEYKVKDGQDTMLFANGISGKSILNEAITRTNQLTFGIEYKF